jgi:hypothetical protein
VNNLVNHRHEKRLGRLLNNASLSCAWYKVCGTEEDGSAVKPWHLSYELTLRYCIKCNAEHYFLGKVVDIAQPEFNPNDYWTWQLEEMGFFDKTHESNRPND